MPKQINITDIKIKEFLISLINNRWNVSVLYSLAADDGSELPPKRDQFNDFNQGQENHFNNILNTLAAKIKQKEKI